MARNKQELIDAIEHISFEMNRYLYTAYPIFPLPGRYLETVAESCLLHSRAIGEFFFEQARKDDIRFSHYEHELISKDVLKIEIEKSRSEWELYKERTNKRLCHLTFSRVVKPDKMSMQEHEKVNFGILIKLFENNLPIDYKEKWDFGKLFSPGALNPSSASLQ